MSFGGGKKTTEVVQTNSVPAYITDQHQQNIATANQIASQPYQTYTGPRIADFNGDQQLAFQLTRNAALDQQPTNGHGVSHEIAATYQAPTVSWQNANAASLNRGDIRNVAAQTIPGTDLTGYLNPYTKNVVDTTLGELGRQNDILQNQTRARAAAAGGFGGSRSAILESENNRNYLDQAARTSAQLNAAAYDSATGLAQADANRKLQADMSNQGMDWNVGSLNTQNAQQTNVLNAQGAYNAQVANQNASLQGTQLRLQGANQSSRDAFAEQQQRLANAQALAGVGAAEQGLTQSNFDTAYADFLRQQNYPIEQLALRQSILSGTPYSSTSTSEQPYYTNRAGNFLSGAMGGAQLGNMLGGSTGAAIGGIGGGLLSLFG